MSEVKGVVYTKRWVAELILDLAGYRSDIDLAGMVAVEPAAGDGAFLGPMIERLFESCKVFGRSIRECASSLIAFEVDEASSEVARSLAVETLSGLGVEAAAAERLATGWVRTGDYLLDSLNINADFVMGNPPYVRLEDIPAATAEYYREIYATMRGRADLYIAFFELALRQLKPTGVCAFICADRWMRNQYGAELRRLVTSEFAVETVVEMHAANAFDDDVDAYPAITVIRRQTQATTLVASANTGVESIGTGTLFATLRASARREPLALPCGLRTAVVETWFRGADPWPCHSPEQMALLRRLEDQFPALEASAKVGIGVATGNDEVFITRDPGLVEPSRLLKLALARDIGSGKMEWSGHYLVDPWNGDGLVDLTEFPGLRSYFESHAPALARRHTALKNAKGWYKTIDRVTHSLTGKPKLYIADIKCVLDPVLDCGETYPHHNLYFIESASWDLEVLGGILMSDVGQFFVSSYGVRMRGGYWRFQAQYLRRIRVPHPGAVSSLHAEELRTAFRGRDRKRATQSALEIFCIEARELEIALGDR